jgi:protein-tyrosine phosphatase
VRWATDRGFQAILSIYKPGDRDPKHLWLTTLIQESDDKKLTTNNSKAAADQQDNDDGAASDDGSESSTKDDIKWASFEVDIDDSDKTSASWEKLSPQLPKMLKFINTAVAEGRELLVHCENGVSTAPALVLMYGLIKRRIRLDDGLKSMMAKRREVKVSRSLYAGLASLEAELDLRKMDRLDARLRNSSVMSLGF